MSNSVPAIFKDPGLQTQFDRDGFVKISLLQPQDVEQLLSLFKNYFPDPSKDFFSSSYENDFPRKKEISEAIGRIMEPGLAKIFTDYTRFGSAFLSKGDGPRSEMPMHQDWTIVDETKFVALNIWTPLQETTEENGTLEVLKGSHRWHNTLRAPTLPFYFQGFESRLKTKLTAIPALPTEAIVLNQAVIHYSKANKTGDIRVAITTGIKSKGAPMLFHYWNKEQPAEIEQFKQEEDFLISFTDFHQSIFKRPAMGQSQGTKPFQLRKPTQQEVSALLGEEMPVAEAGIAKQEAVNTSKKSFGQKILAWMKG